MSKLTAAANTIISPSGKLYGSEQVLSDYLNYSKKEFDVFISGKKLLYRSLIETTRRGKVFSFRNVQMLYIKIALQCFLGKIRTLYINEAGHSRYVTLLAKLFPRITFIIHVRLFEDTMSVRWRISAPCRNLTLIAVSKCLQKALPLKSLQLYDPYPFNTNVYSENSIKEPGTLLKVGVVGRVSVTKGIDGILQLLEIIKTRNLTRTFQFYFYGEVLPDVSESGRKERLLSYENINMEGFVSDKEQLYGNIHCVLHACFNESLGRVFLESVDYAKPFVGINIYGIGEIGAELNLTQLLVENSSDAIGELFLEKLLFLRENYPAMVENIKKSQATARRIFSIENYTKVLDGLTG